jgi:hypothetical protein
MKLRNLLNLSNRGNTTVQRGGENNESVESSKNTLLQQREYSFKGQLYFTIDFTTFA